MMAFQPGRAFGRNEVLSLGAVSSQPDNEPGATPVTNSQKVSSIYKAAAAHQYAHRA
jgi:hypothetical protein